MTKQVSPLGGGGGERGRAVVLVCQHSRAQAPPVCDTGCADAVAPPVQSQGQQLPYLSAMIPPVHSCMLHDGSEYNLLSVTLPEFTCHMC